MFCGKCGNNINLPNDYTEYTIVCSKCGNVVKVIQKHIVPKEQTSSITENKSKKISKNESEKNLVTINNKDLLKEKIKTKIINKDKINTVIVSNENHFKEQNSSKKTSSIEAKIITAGKLQQGTRCSICKEIINIGDKLYICNFCKSTNHEDCWVKNGGCPVAECASKLSLEERAEKTQTKIPHPTINNQDEMITCKWCKEPMKKGAVYCPSCGESQSKSSLDEDDNSYYKYDDSPPLEKWEYFVLFATPLLGFKMPNLFMFGIFMLLMPLFGVFHIKTGDFLKGKKILKISLIYEGFLLILILSSILK